MATYRYKAVDATGRRVSGTMEAAGPADLETRLTRVGLDLVTSRTARGRRLAGRLRTVPRRELINFSFHLEQLLGAGVPAVPALRDLASSLDDPGFRDIVAETAEAIEGGRTLSQALAGFPEAFSHVYVSMVRAGEESGRLPTVLNELASMLRWQDEVLAHARQVMIYPAVVLVVVAAVIVFLMMYLVPRLTGFLASMNAELPAHSRALVIASDFFLGWWWLLAMLIVALPVTLRTMAGRSPRLRYRLDAIRLRLWLFGNLVRDIRLARFASTFALMYAAGISVLDALRLSRDLMDNAVLEQAIDRVHESIAEGGNVSDSFAATGVFPPLVVRMLKVGETSGALDTALHKVSHFYSREVREAVERLQPTIQPLLTALLGALVGWIMLAVLGPVYDAITTMDM